MGCQPMSLIKAAIHSQPRPDQPQPTFTDAQWNHLLSTLKNAIHAPTSHSRTDLQHLHSWLLHIRSASGTST